MFFTEEGMPGFLCHHQLLLLPGPFQHQVQVTKAEHQLRWVHHLDPGNMLGYQSQGQLTVDSIRSFLEEEGGLLTFMRTWEVHFENARVTIPNVLGEVAVSFKDIQLLPQEPPSPKLKLFCSRRGVPRG